MIAQPRDGRRPGTALTGEADSVWPASAMAASMVERLERASFAHEAIHLNYADAGHIFGGGEKSYGIAYLLPRERRTRNGGSIAGNSIAGIAAWQATTHFLDRAFSEP